MISAKIGDITVNGGTGAIDQHKQIVIAKWQLQPDIIIQFLLIKKPATIKLLAIVSWYLLR